MIIIEKCVSNFFKEGSHDDSITFENPPGVEPLQFKLNHEASSLKYPAASHSDSLNVSQKYANEEKPMKILPFFNITPREMPRSPHFVLEEEFSANPWATLVATIFLTKTTAKTAKPYMRSFFEEYPTPYHVLNDTPLSLERFFENLGLKKRGHIIWKMTYQFIAAKWRRASDLCGIGKYGEDAYRIFCLGHVDLEPRDRYLRLYLDWLRGHTGFLKEEGVIDSAFIIEDRVLKYYTITLRDVN